MSVYINQQEDSTAFTVATYRGQLSQENLLWHSLHHVGEGLQEVLLPTWRHKIAQWVKGG